MGSFKKCNTAHHIKVLENFFFKVFLLKFENYFSGFLMKSSRSYNNPGVGNAAEYLLGAENGIN